MVDFINEVEEELRKDKYNELLRKYGPYILGLIVAIVAVAGYLEWDKASSDKKARATSAAYVMANDLESEGNLERAYTQFIAISKKAPSGYSGLSLMRAAAIKLELGARVEAVELFDKAADEFKIPRHSQLAQIKAVYILANDGKYADVLTRIEPLAKKGEPYEFLARELMAYAAQQSGDMSKARQELSYLSTIPGVPDSIKNRADQSLSLMKVEASLTAAPKDSLDDLDESALNTATVTDGSMTDEGGVNVPAEPSTEKDDTDE